MLQDENAVEAALLFNDKKFPPMLPRKLRVVRAKAIKRSSAKNSKPSASFGPRQNSVYQPKVSSEQQSLQGRAGKLFGKAGAANLNHGAGRPRSSIKPPEAFVFEGHRASSGQKPRLKTKKGKSGKPQTRSSRRGAAWKAAGATKKAK